MTKENENEEKIDESNSDQTIVPTIDSYQASLQYEEMVIKERSESEDQEAYSLICKELRSLIKEILKLKTEKPDQWENEVEERKIKGLMLMLSLRRLSRIQKVRVRDSREKSTEFRQRVDAITLQLQNLLYEVSHLKKEVRKCLEFQSADSEIDLVPIDQFYMEAPENISRPEETVENVHQQRLAQLHWELEQRRGQTQLSDKLTQEKERVADIITEQEGKLESLAPRIISILEATLPLQKALNLPLDSKREQQKTAHFLPAPLYTLWVQASAYGEACDSSIHTEIQGDVEAAKKLASLEEDTKSEASDSEGELDIQEENAQRKSRSRGEKKSQDYDDNGDVDLKQLLALHPLSVVLTIKAKENSVVVKFYYAQSLRIMTTKCFLNVSETSKPILIDILNNDNFLNLLFPDDMGLKSPNPSNEYQFQKILVSGLTEEHLNIIGKPYKWTQTLAGLSFMLCELQTPPEPMPIVQAEDDEEKVLPEEAEIPKQHTETLSWKVSAEHMHHTVMAIRRRLQSRLALHSQLVSLEGASSTSAIPVPTQSLAQLFPGKVCSELISWKPIAWPDYLSSPATHQVIASGVVTEHFVPFKAVYQRESVTLTAFVAISPDYPNVAPIFALLLQWHKEDTASTNSHVREMESEVNTHFGELASNRKERLHLLSLQLYRLAICLDILTESISSQMESNASSSSTFHKEKIFFRPARGPDRALPFKYLSKLGVFAQR